MNIAFDAKRAFLNFTGLGNYSRFVIEALAKHAPQHQYILYTTKISSGADVQALWDNSSINIRTPSKLVSRLGMTNIWRSALLGNVALRDGAQIFHGLSNELPLITKRGLKTVVTIHDLLYLRYPNFYKWADVEIYKRKFRHACKVADVVVAVSEQTAQDLQEFLKVPANKIQVIYQGCHVNFRSEVGALAMQRAAEKYQLPIDFILNVGTIEDRKNALLIVQALQQLKGKLDAPLVIVGRSTPYTRQILDFVRQHKLESQVKFLHEVNFEDLPAIYQLAKVFVYPSHFEGFGIPIIEALHSHVPVIAAKGSCLHEAGGPHSIYVDPNDPEELADALQSIVQNPALASKMILHGEEWVKQFDPAAIATRFNEVYEKLL